MRPTIPAGVLDSLSADRQERLAELLEVCFERLERGERCETEDLLRQHPDLAEPLAGLLQSLSLLHHVVCDAPAKYPLPLTMGATSEHRLGDYRLLREIGRGGMGVVYEATQISLGRRVALKVLPFAAVLDERQIARFHNEALAAAQLHHNHIVPVYAVGCERGVHYYSMQLIDGQSLDQVMNEVRGAQRTELMPTRESRNGETRRSNGEDSASATSPKNSAIRDTPGGFSTVPTIRSRQYVRSIAELGIHAADALDYAHSCGVVHRDIKPSNLLLDRQGKLWIADFGLARCRSGNDLTQVGELLGTVRYMSPEQASGQTQWVDHRTDIYALGITLYELLTLRPVFDGMDRQQVIRQIEREDPPALKSLNSAVGGDLQTIVAKAMSKSRDDRYQTARELADDLRRYLDGRPTRARRITPIDRTTRYVIRHARRFVAFTCLLLVALAGITTAALMIAHRNLQIEAARQRAELHLDTAQRVVERFDSEITQRLELVPGTEAVRVRLLQEALDYYQSFARYAQDDAALQRDLAQTQLKMASLSDRLGRIEAAIDAYGQARLLFINLARQDGTTFADRAAAALCENNRGVLFVKLGQYAEAAQSYKRALEEQNALLVERPEDRTVLVDWANTNLNQGRLQTQMDRFHDARLSLSIAETHFNQLAQKQPGDRDIQINLAAVLSAFTALPPESPTRSRQRLQAQSTSMNDCLPHARMMRNLSPCLPWLTTISGRRFESNILGLEMPCARRIRCAASLRMPMNMRLPSSRVWLNKPRWSSNTAPSLRPPGTIWASGTWTVD